jgi:subtilisin family serine protease
MIINTKKMFVFVAGMGCFASAFSASPTRAQQCIEFGPQPSLIIELKNKHSLLNAKKMLKQSFVHSLSYKDVQFTHSRPLVNDLYLAFFDTSNTNSLLKQQTAHCYTQESLNKLIHVVEQKHNVRSVKPNALLKLDDADNQLSTIPSFSGNMPTAIQWDMLSAPGGIDAYSAWQSTTMGSPTVITAVLDTGILDNESLTPNLLPGVHFTDNGVNKGIGATPSCDSICSGYDHGTHVAGTVGASGDLAYGLNVYGVAPRSKILPINVFTKYLDAGVWRIGSYTADLINAYNWINGTASYPTLPLQAPTNIVSLNLSLGGAGLCSTQAEFDSLIAQNKTIVVAAGNSNVDVVTQSPANCTGVIAVAATGPSGERASYSNWGAAVTIAAPGGNFINNSSTYNRIYSTVLDSYAVKQGTSMASPHVAGLVALLYSIDPTMNSSKVIATITDPNNNTAFPTQAEVPGGTTSCINPLAPLQTCGAGIIDAYKATNSARATSSLPMLTSATRNPFNNTEAYIYYTQNSAAPSSVSYSLSGITGAQVTIEPAKQRFKITGISTPKSFTAVVIASYAGQPSPGATNPIVIPAIL